MAALPVFGAAHLCFAVLAKYGRPLYSTPPAEPDMILYMNGGLGPAIRAQVIALLYTVANVTPEPDSDDEPKPATLSRLRQSWRP